MEIQRFSTRSALALPLVAAIALASCDASERSAEDGPDTLGAAGGAETRAPATPPAGPRMADTVEVRLEEFTIVMPDTLPAGPTAFRVTNAGTVAHNFEVEGQGMEEEFETNLAPGDTRTLQVDLSSGEYTIYCPVANHREQGMELTLTVTAGAGGGTTGAGAGGGAAADTGGTSGSR